MSPFLFSITRGVVRSGIKTVKTHNWVLTLATTVTWKYFINRTRTDKHTKKLLSALGRLWLFFRVVFSGRADDFGEPKDLSVSGYNFLRISSQNFIFYSAQHFITKLAMRDTCIFADLSHHSKKFLFDCNYK